MMYCFCKKKVSHETSSFINNNFINESNPIVRLYNAPFDTPKMNFKKEKFSDDDDALYTLCDCLR